eukprot:3193088-Amphidinium_carterae.1
MNNMHWCVQSQLLRRGGLRSGKPVPVKEIDGRIQQLRAAAKAEEASKKGDNPNKGDRKAGGSSMGTWEDGHQAALTRAEDELRRLLWEDGSDWLRDQHQPGTLWGAKAEQGKPSWESTLAGDVSPH